MKTPKTMDTLSGMMNSLKEKGYKEEFRIEDGALQTSDGGHSFQPKQLKINEHYRFEGASDPGDMTVLYAIETDNGVKGILIDGFGTYSDPKQAEFMQKIRELHKSNIY